MTLPRALLFDMDGTVVDTEKYWDMAEHGFFADRGVHWTSEMGKDITGMALVDSVTAMARKTGLDLNIPDAIDEMNQRVHDLVMERGAPWLPGALETLELAKSLGIKTALVTSSWRIFTQAVIDQGPAGAFDTVVAGDEVKNGKPHPEPYAKAARRLGTEAKYCMAFEDSPSGANSAVAAGAMTFVLPGNNPVSPDLDVTLIDSLEDIDLAWLKRYWNS